MMGNRKARVFSHVVASAWTKILLAFGWILFWLAASAGERVPVAAVLVGPGIMLFALILLARSKSRLSRRTRT